MADSTNTAAVDTNFLPYPLTKAFFLIKVGAFTGNMAFTEVSGLDASVDVVEFRQGNSPYLTPIKIPGLVKHSNCTLKYGLVAGLDVRKWILNCVAENRKDFEKMDITIELVDSSTTVPGTVKLADTTEGLTWTLKNAFVTSYKGPDLESKASEVAIETIEIAYERLEIANEKAKAATEDSSKTK